MINDVFMICQEMGGWCSWIQEN